MKNPRSILILVIGLVLGCSARIAGAARQEKAEASSANLSQYQMLNLPPSDGPVVVRARFDLHDIVKIDDEAETVEFSGILTVSWQDPRQQFDPAITGVREKRLSGDFQVAEISPGWFPQVVLANEAGLYEKHGVLLRIQQDGTSTLVEKVNAIARIDLDLRRYPFDSQSLEAVFEVLGFDDDQVVLEAADRPSEVDSSRIRLPQWTLLGLTTGVRSGKSAETERASRGSYFVISIHLQRQSLFMMRLVVVPLTLIVMLSWSVFWMDRSSLGDRINVSFIGILTAVAYQVVVGGILPQISYVTLLNGFLNLSFITMCATVVINLVVGSADKHGSVQLGDRIDRRCRWIFPVVYFLALALAVIVAFVFF